MSGAKVVITVDGRDEFNRVFSRLDANFDDLTPIWPDVRDKFWLIEGEQFDSEGSKGASGPWKQLSKRYAKQKVDRYGAGKKILEATGELRDSLTGNNPGSFYWADPKEMAIGTTLARGIYHQRGNEKMPARPPISMSDDQKRDLMKTVQSSLVTQLRRGKYYVPVYERNF
jgi:phage gpG-like protein